MYIIFEIKSILENISINPSYTWVIENKPIKVIKDFNFKPNGTIYWMTRFVDRIQWRNLLQCQEEWKCTKKRSYQSNANWFKISEDS